MSKYKNTKVASNRQEKRIAKELGAKVTIASGALDFQKADVRNDIYLVEAKTTEKHYYAMNLTTWKKIENQALKDGMRVPVMCIDLEDGKYPIAVLTENDYLVLTDTVDESKYVFLDIESPIKDKVRKSCRIFNQFLIEPVELKHGYINCRMQRLSFADGTNLVLLDWNDFIILQGEITNE